jgi:hypothetical protein
MPAGSSYKVEEILPDPCADGSYWLQTAPVADTEGFKGIRVQHLKMLPVWILVIFALQGTGGFTLGFWSNKNGQKRMETDAITNVYVFTPMEPDPERWLRRCEC